MKRNVIDHQKFYLAEKNCQIEILRGSYSLRLAVLDHPFIEGDISINMGIAKEGYIINTGYFYNSEKTWKIQIELLPLDENSEHRLAQTDNSSVDNLISCLLNMFVQDESNLLHSQQVNHPIPNPIILENLSNIPPNYHFTTTKNYIFRFQSGNIEKNNMPSLFISNCSINSYLLETNIVILPAHITHTSGSKELNIDADWNKLANEENFIREISTAWVNFITSIYLFTRINNYEKELSSKNLRKSSNNLSNIILSDYSGVKDISNVSNVLASLPVILIDQLREYLDTIGLKLEDLCLPSQFSSTILVKKFTQILDISYIPYRKFNTNKIYDCKVIGSYILFQEEKTQLHLQSYFKSIILPKDVSIIDGKPITCIQLFERLPEEVRWWTLLKFMLRGTYIELAVVVAIALTLSLITLLPPIAITYTLSSLLPYSSTVPFIQIIGLLIVIGSAAFILKLIQARYAVRLETKADINIQSFTTSRLLQLPAAAILNENSGDLESRVSYLSQLRNIFTSTLSPFLTLSFTIVFNLCLLVRYSWPSAIFSLIPLSIIVCSSLYVGYKKSNLLKIVLKNDGKIFSGLFTFIAECLCHTLLDRWIRLDKES